MLPTTRYAPGAYPPSLAFPQLGGAKVQRYFKKFDALQSQGHLASMNSRKQSLRELHQAKVADLQPANVQHGDPLEHWYEADEGGEPTPTEQAPPRLPLPQWLKAYPPQQVSLGTLGLGQTDLEQLCARLPLACDLQALLLGLAWTMPRWGLARSLQQELMQPWLPLP